MFRKTILTLAAVVAVFPAVLAGVTSAQAERLTFQSYEPGDHRGIFSGNWKQNPFSARAELNASAEAGAPLVVYSPGWGGADKYVPAFKDIRDRLGNGYHHLFLSVPDSIDLAGRTVTIFEAIRAAKARGLDPSKVLLVGASGGGQEAIHATHQRVAATLGAGIPIAGVVAFYPSCRVSFDDRSFRQIPILIMVGGKDMVAPGKLCKELQSGGALSHARIQEFSNAGHSWLMTQDASTHTSRTWGDCRITIDQSGVWHGEGFDSTGGIGGMLDGMGRKCGKKIKMTIGRDGATYSASVQAAVDFLKGL